MNKDNTSGILIIVSGVWGILSAIGFAFASIMMPRIMDSQGTFGFPDAFWIIYRVSGVVYFLLGIVSIIGGIFAIRRTSWGWALAGAIASIFAFLPAGIVALIFLFKIQSQFLKPNPDKPINS